MIKSLMKYVILSLIIPSVSYALPIDWHGTFGVDTTLVDTFRRIENTTQTATIPSGSQEVPLASGNHANASFQSYLFKLQPVIIVNDSATIKGELTSGYNRGGRLGDNSTRSLRGDMGNALYLQNRPSTNSSMLLNSLYAELYSDTATYLVGRHSTDWALGALYNSGANRWDRHLFTRDGITAKIKIGNFEIAPYWSKVSSAGSLTRATRAKEWGTSLLYDNPESDLAFGLLYASKENNAFEQSIQSNVNGTGNTNLGKTDVSVVDLYIKKDFGNFDIAVEAPIVSGEIGYIYNTTDISKYGAKAVIIETNYDLNDRWVIGLDVGQVSGDDGSKAKFEAMYLNPNFQIANLLFRYNLNAISSPVGSASAESVYDSYISNARYFKLHATHTAEKWTWMFGVIYAMANEVAEVGKSFAFDHEDNLVFTPNANQEKDLGIEIDFGFDYNWNDEISINASIGYLLTGDYFAFSNTGTPNVVKNTYALQLGTSIDF